MVGGSSFIALPRVFPRRPRSFLRTILLASLLVITLLPARTVVRAGGEGAARRAGSPAVRRKAASALPPGTPILPAVLVNTVDTSNAAWLPSSPDPSGVDYWPLTGRMLVVDSEVDEMPPYFTGVNIYDATTTGTLVSTCSTTNLAHTGWSNEPTGLAINPSNNHLYITDDSKDKVFEVSFGLDGIYCTADDVVTSLTLVTDAEDVAYGNNKLFIAGGSTAQVNQFDLGADGVLGGGDDGPITSWPTNTLGFTDLEGITYNPDTGTLFLVSTAPGDRYLGEATTDGVLLRAWDLSFMGTQGNIRSDVAFGPSSTNPSVSHVYIVSRGVDNDAHPEENDGKWWEIALNTEVSVTIGGALQGTYPLAPAGQQRVNYTGLDSGPVIVSSVGGVEIIAALRDAWTPAGQTDITSFTQLMGLPESQLSDTYYFPAYNNVTLNEQIRFGNLGTSSTDVTITIGGIPRGTYPLEPGQQQRINYPGLDSGPVVVKSSGGVKIIAAIRDAWTPPGQSGITSFTQLMGLPQSQLSDSYSFPAYNNVSLDEQIRFGNVGSAETDVTVIIGGIPRGTYHLLPGGQQRVNYTGIDGGPVVVQSSGGVKIIAAIRDAWTPPGGSRITSFAQLMGLPSGALSTRYFFPAYNNVNLDEQLRFGNVGLAETDVTVTIGGVVRGTYHLLPGGQQRVNYAGLDSGPVLVESSGGVPIIAAIREAWTPPGQSAISSYTQFMGLPGSQLSDTYYFPAYNNVNLDEQLRFGVP